MSKRETLTVVIMTKNSDSLIEGCLQSASWADEIVIWDGQSTDRTLEICRKFTDKIFQSPFSGSFGEERNRATAKATSDWCLHIDPDERLTSEFRQKITEILNSGTAHNAFEFRKKNIFLGHWMKHGGWYHYSLHFFRRIHARYEGIVHENLMVQGTVGKIETPVEHYPFVSFNQFLKRHNRYSSMEAREEMDRHGRLEPKRVRYELEVKPVKRFFKFFVKKKGFLDGSHGLIFCTLYAWVHFINWAKYWELLKEKNEVCISRS